MRNLICCISLCVSSICFGKVAMADAGSIVSVKGQASVMRNAVRYRAIPNARLVAGDVIQTKPHSTIAWRLEDNSTYSMLANSELTISEFSFQRKKNSSTAYGRLVLNLAKGGFRSLSGLIGSRARASYLIRTPSATMGIRGTEYTIIQIDEALSATSSLPAGTYVIVHKGSVNLTNDLGSSDFSEGQQGFSPLGQKSAPYQIQLSNKELEQLIALIQGNPTIDDRLDSEFPDDDNDLPQVSDTTIPPVPDPEPYTIFTPPSPTQTPNTTAGPTLVPSPSPVSTTEPTIAPSPSPTSTTEPTAAPSPSPTSTTEPTAAPSPSPTSTTEPTVAPSPSPTMTPMPSPDPTLTPDPSMSPS